MNVMAPSAPPVETTVLHVGGLHYAGEKGVVEHALGGRPGVIEVEANAVAQTATVTFDPARISYDTLLEWFFRSHDPTTLNRQGNDVGTQYRSVIFTHSEAQRTAALAAIQKAQPKFAEQIVTQVSPAPRFWPAEDYHQDYFRKHPSQGYCRVMIAPKLKKLGLDH